MDTYPLYKKTFFIFSWPSRPPSILSHILLAGRWRVAGNFTSP